MDNNGVENSKTNGKEAVAYNADGAEGKVLDGSKDEKEEKDNSNKSNGES